MEEANKTETEPVEPKPTETKELSMTPAAIAKRASRARQAAKADADQPAEVRRERAKARVEAGWKKNWDSLSKEQKHDINEQILQFNAVHELMGWKYAYVLADKKELCPDDVTFFKNIFVDVEEFATQFPPIDDDIYRQAHTGNPSHPIDFTELEPRLGKYPRFFRLYGEPVDHISAVSYGSFLHYFSVFHRKYRHAGVAENDEEFAVSWEKVDELIRKNERLSKKLLVTPIASVAPVVAPRPLSEAELVKQAVDERHVASLGIQD